MRVAKCWQRLPKEAAEAHLQRLSTTQQGPVQPSPTPEMALLCVRE